MASKQQTELAWAAGFFDGEGHVNNHRARSMTMRIDIAQVDRRVLDRFGRALGMGRVNGPYDKGGNKQPIFHWRTTRQEEVLRAFKLLKPYLGEVKARQFREVIRMKKTYSKGMSARMSAAGKLGAAARWGK